MARKIFTGVLAAGAAAVALLAGGASLLRRKEPHLVFSTQSGLARIFNIAVPDGSMVRVLKVGGAYQSATYLGQRKYQPVFEYYRSFDHMFDPGIPIGRVLMVGGGGCAYAKHLLSTNDEVSLDVVELDPAIAKAARRWFFVDDLVADFELTPQRFRLIVDDGVDFIAQSGQATYDVIINDAFLGAAPTVGLLSAACLDNTKRALVKDGLYLLNAVIGPGDDHVLDCYMGVLSEAFSRVFAIPCIDADFSGADNYLLVATDGDYHFADAATCLCG